MKRFDTGPAPHLPPRNSVRRVMTLVLALLLPGTVMQTAFFGIGVPVQILLAVLFALLVEAAMLRLRGQPLRPSIGDGSAVVTAWLFALCIPPLAPWWIAALAMLAAIGCAKHLYGGLGHNLFNPAMVGYAMVLVCFPLELSQWPPPAGLSTAGIGIGDTLAAIVTGAVPGGDWDALTAATPIDLAGDRLLAGATLTEIHADAAFAAGARAWRWIALAFALGGIALCLLRVADWRTPAAVLGTVVLVTTPFWLADPDGGLSPLGHVFGGGLVMAAFFIATDPVSGATTPLGRWLFGAGVAVLILAIRQWGAYPDGIAFAVLLMNAAAPLLDRLTPPRIFGHRR